MADEEKEGEVTPQMADEEKEGEVIPSRGADWEVVQLTASTYAAAPGPDGLGPDDERSQQESSSAMFMSDHFVFPPSEHENLPIEPDRSEVDSESEGEDKNFAEEKGDDPHITHEERCQDKFDDESQRIQLVDSGSTFSVSGMEFEVGEGLQGLQSVPCPENTDVDELGDSTAQNIDSPPVYRKTNEEDEHRRSGIPCKIWLKRHAMSLYRHAKDANTFWSIVVAAALTGLVILGKRWQRDKWHLHELKRQFSINDERTSRMLGPLGRFKDIIVGGQQRSPLIGGGASAYQ